MKEGKRESKTKRRKIDEKLSVYKFFTINELSENKANKIRKGKMTLTILIQFCRAAIK